jgi:hypothetical protein
MYAYVCDLYPYLHVLHALHVLDYWGTDHVPKTPSCDPAPGGTHSGHPRACAAMMCPSTLSLHPCPSPPTPEFEHPPRATCLLGPIGHPPVPLGSCALRPRRSCLKPCHSLSGMVAPQHPAGLGRHSLAKTHPDRDWLAPTHLLRALQQVGTQGIQGHMPWDVYLALPVTIPLQDPILRVHVASVCTGMCMYVQTS